MFLLNAMLLYILLITVAASSVLDAPAAAPDNHLQETEATINRTFTLLGLNPSAAVKVNHYAHLIIQNFLTLLTLRDHSVLKDITHATRANKTNDNETIFMADYDYDLFENIDVMPSELDENKPNNNSDAVLDEIERIIDSINEISNDTNKEGYRKYLDVYGVYEHNVTAAIDAVLDEVLFDESDDEENIIDDSDIWKPSGRRIFQGKISKVKIFPFMASIHVFGNFKCAGSIIKRDLIITAASCLQLTHNNRFFRENPEYLKVRVGSSYYFGGGETIPVLEVYFYPSYNPMTLKNNLAILRLRYHIQFKKRRIRVKRIEIDRNAHLLPVNTENITVVGWGAKLRSNQIQDPYTNKLTYKLVNVYGLEECKEFYEKYVSNECFCAGWYTKGAGACNHDVGGPGIVDGVLTGIISFGSPACGQNNAPTVFVKLGFYASWIDEIMSQEIYTNYQFTTGSTTSKIITDPTTEKIGMIEPVINEHSELITEPKPVEQEENTEFVLLPEDIENIVEIPEEIKLTARKGKNRDKQFEQYLTKMFGSKEDISGFLGAGMRQSQLYKMFLNKNKKTPQYDNAYSKSDEILLNSSRSKIGINNNSETYLTNEKENSEEKTDTSSIESIGTEYTSEEQTGTYKSEEYILPLKQKKESENIDTDNNSELSKFEDNVNQELSSNDVYSDGVPVLSEYENTKSKLHRQKIPSTYSGTDAERINTDKFISSQELNGKEISNSNEKSSEIKSIEILRSAEEPEKSNHHDKNTESDGDGNGSVGKNKYSIEEATESKGDLKREDSEEITKKSIAQTQKPSSIESKYAENMFKEQKKALEALEALERQINSDDDSIGVINLDDIMKFDNHKDLTIDRREDELKPNITDGINIEVTGITENNTAIIKIQIPDNSTDIEKINIPENSQESSGLALEI